MGSVLGVVGRAPPPACRREHGKRERLPYNYEACKARISFSAAVLVPTSPRSHRRGEMADATNPLGHGPVASSDYGLLVFLSVAVAVRVIVGEPPMPVTVKR
jgi:hypothetical protein